MQFVKTLGGLFGLLAIVAGAPAMAADTIKIGFLDPLSGPFANVGEHGTREMELVIEGINAAGGVLGGTKF